MIYAFEIEFQVTGDDRQPLLDALDIAIEASKHYDNVVHFGKYIKFEAVLGSTEPPEEKVVFLQSYNVPDGNRQHFMDPVVQEKVHPVFDKYPSKIYHYMSV